MPEANPQAPMRDGLREREYPQALRTPEGNAIDDRRSAVGLPQRSDHDSMTEVIGLALSGGGIRSATFALGLLQSLAWARLLRRIDIASTVSGGGYVGSFLGMLFCRDPEDLRLALAQVGRESREKPPSSEPGPAEGPAGPVDGGGSGNAPVGEGNGRFRCDLVEDILRDGRSRPIEWLRENGRYIAPNGAGDFTLATAVVLRNWVALQLVIVIFLLFNFLTYDGLRHVAGWILACSPWPSIPAVIVAALEPGLLWWSPWLIAPALLLVFAVVPVGCAYWLLPWDGDPAAQKNRGRTLAYQAAPFVLALIGSVGALAIHFLYGPIFSWFGIGIAGLVALECALTFAWFYRLDAGPARSEVSGSSSRQKSQDQRDGSSEQSSRRAGDRSGPLRHPERFSSTLSLCLGLTVFFTGVAIVDSCGQSLFAVLAVLNPADLHSALSWLGSGLLLALAAAQQITSFIHGRTGSEPLRPSLDAVASAVALPLAFVILVSVCAVGHAFSHGWQAPAGAQADTGPGDEMLARWGIRKPTVPGQYSLEGAAEVTVRGGHPWIVARGAKVRPLPADSPVKTPGVPIQDAWLWASWITTFLLSLLMDCVWPFVNRSSQQELYADRLTRAYLGASNPKRWEETTSVLDVDPKDGCPMDGYRPHSRGGPLHFINVTINETMDGRSQVEQRDRKGLGMAIGPCGVSVHAHHHALWDEAGGKAGESPPGRKRELLGITPPSVPSSRRDGEKGAAGTGSSGPDAYCIFPRRANTGSKAIPDRSSAPPPIIPERLGVERWMGISGAAFTTGLGARTSLGLSLLCGMFNIRLGYWWDSGIDPAGRKGRMEEPFVLRMGSALTRAFPVQMYLLDELTARFHGTARRHWYLSDGGHFENMGAYELIRRRAGTIIICDAEQDEDYAFEGLANLVRKARIDFGADITFLSSDDVAKVVDPSVLPFIGSLEQIRRGTWTLEPVLEREGAVAPTLWGAQSDSTLDKRAIQIWRTSRRTLTPDQTQYSLVYAALARVTYPDPQAPQTFILYIKPALTGYEPIDILQYHHDHAAFPHEPTTDQFFDEAQWESYRRLGLHAGESLFRERPGVRMWTPNKWLMEGAVPRPARGGPWTEEG